MNKSKAREHLAVNVMKLPRIQNGEQPYYEYDEFSLDVIWVEDWRPDEKIEQAMMLLDKFEQWGISRNLVDEGYFVSIVEWNELDSDDKDWEAEHEILTKAITNAVLQATGYTND